MTTLAIDQIIKRIVETTSDWPVIYIGVGQEAVISGWETKYWPHLPETEGRLDYYWVMYHPVPFDDEQEEAALFAGPMHQNILSDCWDKLLLPELRRKVSIQVFDWVQLDSCKECEWGGGCELIKPCPAHSIIL